MDGHKLKELVMAPNVLIADDHPLFRTALKQAIELSYVNSTDVEISEASDVDTLMQIMSEQDMDVVFLDLHMPGNNGFTALTQLRNHYPDIEVIMVSADEQPEVMLQAVDYGASAFVPKSADLDTIGQAINTVLDGEVWLPQHVYEFDRSQFDADVAARKKLSQQLSELTPQQYKVLSLIADGQLNKQIAYELDIKETTVKKHVSAILEKLQVNNRTLAGMAFQQLQLTAS